MKKISGRFRSQKNATLASAYTIFFGKAFITLIVLCVITQAHAQQDTVKTATTLQVLPRLHSAGYFPFSGALLNHSPVADVNVFYERNSAARATVGFFVFQSFDFKDRHSYANYFQPGLFGTVRLHPTFKIRGFFGYIFSQTRSFRDPGDSDYYAATTLYWDPTKHISIQNTVLFYDYNINRKLANRVLVSCTYNKFKADFYVWNRVVMAEKRQAVSASIALTFPIIKVGEKPNTSIQLTSAYMWYLTSYRPGFALDKGFIFTLGVPVNVKG
jgi:hypothetical protein